jgi:tetratricopeptide (TPR) repeat protein
MAIEPSQRQARATTPAAAVAAAFADVPKKKKRISRRTKMTVCAVIPVVAVALGAVSASMGLIGSKKASSTPSPAAKASTLLNAGLTAQTQGHVDVATKDYQQVLALDPANKYAMYDLGFIAQQAGQAAQAEKDYRQALNVDPNFASALFNLAILRTQPAPQEAVDLYRHAVTLNPKDAASHLNLGFLLVSLGQRDEGSAELRLATGIDPKLSSRVPAALIATSTPAPAPKR